MRSFLKLTFVASLAVTFVGASQTQAARIKDIANVRGVRDNQLIG